MATPLPDETKKGGGEGDEATSVPPPWKKEFSKKQNRVYFYNPVTNQSVWSLDDINKIPSATTTANSPGKRKLDDTDVDAETKRQRSDTGKEEEERVRVAIIVPFRDLHAEQKRSAHLREFVPYMDDFLGRRCAPLVSAHKIFIIEQSNDGHKFNRGKLLNIGFSLAAKEGFTSFIFHDVDLLPSEVLTKYYSAPPRKPMHIARCWDRYNKNDKYLGGIVAFSRADFERIDGFPNIYWGWGGEDDELQKRVEEAGIEVVGPPRDIPNAIRDLEEMNLDEKLQFLRENKSWKCNVKWEVNEAHDQMRKRSERPRWWGLRNLDYKILNVDDGKRFKNCAVYTVDLKFNDEVDGKWE